MSQKLVSHSPDLQRLRAEGYEVRVKENILLVSHVPYVNSKKEIKYGILASELNMVSAELTGTPSWHALYFQSEFHPCDRDGNELTSIKNSVVDKEMYAGFKVNFLFSNKPPDGYTDYYQKLTTYINLILAPAVSIDENVTACTFLEIDDEEEDSVFQYPDTNTSRAFINTVSDHLKNQKIAIIGLGGTGSYILDFVAKTPVAEIHLFDGDVFYQHNAFRAPGAPTVADFKTLPKKVEYLSGIYSKMRKAITPHDYHMTPSHFLELIGFSYVFVAMDKGEIKTNLFEFLTERGIPFIDVGMGINNVGNFLIGTLRTTSSDGRKNDHWKTRIPVTNDEDAEYDSNIQIAELNALNAALAIIKWKKMAGFYNDQEFEYHTLYTIDVSTLLNEDFAAPIC